MGYASDSLQNRWSALGAGVILGLVWGLWHVIPYVQTGNAPIWIVWQSLSAVARRIRIVWIYNNTGRSVFAAILAHTMDNVSWSLFPNYGSHYDLFVTGMIVYLIVVVVIFVWVPKTLSSVQTR